MINICIILKNPWHNEQRWPWRDFYQNSWRVTKNKTLEICFDFYPCELANFNLNTGWRGIDHAGPEFSVGLLGFGLRIQLRDNRHWNHEIDDWENITKL